MLNWVEIEGSALANNLREFRRRVGTGPRLGAVVKSNAYGHGMLECARIVAGSGADWLCVNSLDEALALRADGHDLPILVMGYTPRGRAEETARAGASPAPDITVTVAPFRAWRGSRLIVAEKPTRAAIGTSRGARNIADKNEADGG